MDAGTVTANPHKANQSFFPTLLKKGFKFFVLHKGYTWYLKWVWPIEMPSEVAFKVSAIGLVKCKLICTLTKIINKYMTDKFYFYNLKFQYWLEKLTNF